MIFLVILGVVIVMSFQIDELLKINEYDIYHNEKVSDEAIGKIADSISEDPSINLKKYLDLSKCTSKFCWFNFLNILEKLPEEKRINGLPILFELLQDSNWPTFQKTMDILESIDKNVVKLYLNEYLERAYSEDDEMWILNMRLLEKNLN